MMIYDKRDALSIQSNIWAFKHNARPAVTRSFFLFMFLSWLTNLFCLCLFYLSGSDWWDGCLCFLCINYAPKANSKAQNWSRRRRLLLAILPEICRDKTKAAPFFFFFGCFGFVMYGLNYGKKENQHFEDEQDPIKAN